MDGAASHLPAQRLLEMGWESLSEVELMALFLGPGLNEKDALQTAYKVFRQIGSVGKVRESSYATLRTAGLSHRRTLSLLAAFQLARRAGRRVLAPGDSFRSSLEIYRYFRPRVETLRKECFWNVLFDGKNRIRRVVRISEGSLTSSHVHPREVFRPAIEQAAVAVLFVHNHPSGDPVPSQEDIQITRRLTEAGKLMGIRVLDHVIIGLYRYFSFADEGML